MASCKSLIWALLVAHVGLIAPATPVATTATATDAAAPGGVATPEQSIRVAPSDGATQLCVDRMHPTRVVDSYDDEGAVSWPSLPGMKTVAAFIIVAQGGAFAVILGMCLSGGLTAVVAAAFKILIVPAIKDLAADGTLASLLSALAESESSRTEIKSLISVLLADADVAAAISGVLSTPDARHAAQALISTSEVKAAVVDVLGDRSVRTAAADLVQDKIGTVLSQGNTQDAVATLTGEVISKALWGKRSGMDTSHEHDGEHHSTKEHSVPCLLADRQARSRNAIAARYFRLCM